MEQTAKRQEPSGEPACEVCEAPKTWRELSIPALDWKKGLWLATCDCDDKRLEAEQREEAERKERERIDALFASCDLGPRFRRCTFETFTARPGTEKALAAARDYADHFAAYEAEGAGLLFSGEPGVGKTHLLAAVANGLLTNGVSVVFRSSPALLARLRQSFDGRGATNSELLDALIGCRLLILDDLGQEKASEWARETLFHIVNERYHHLRPVAATTNCSFNELSARVGPAVTDRLLEMNCAEIVTGTSYRKELHQRRKPRWQHRPS